MKSPKTAIPRSTIRCARCEQYFFVGAQIVLVRYATEVLMLHPSKRCYSEWEDLLVSQAQVSKRGDKILPVGPEKD